MKQCIRIYGISLLCLATFFMLAGCKGAKTGATKNSFYTTVRPNMTITVQPPFFLQTSGSKLTRLASDTNEQPLAKFNYAIFGQTRHLRVTTFAFTSYTELTSPAWRFELELSRPPQFLSLEKKKINDQDWTIQVMPVLSEKDWFSQFWKENEHAIPPVWLAKRWSQTPTTTKRMTAELRKAAPLCIEKAVLENPAIDGPTLFKMCRQDVEEFDNTTDNVFLFSAEVPVTEEEQQSPYTLKIPNQSPDMKKLVGVVEKNSNSADGRYKRP